MVADRKNFVVAKERLRQRLELALGDLLAGKTLRPEDEPLIDALFLLFKHATKHTIADVLAGHGSTITMLMSMSYAQKKED